MNCEPLLRIFKEGNLRKMLKKSSWAEYRHGVTSCGRECVILKIEEPMKKIANRDVKTCI